MKRQRAATSLGGLVAVAILALAGVAFACTPSAQISLSSSTGAAGSSVMVSGTAFNPGPVQLHWSSASGPLLGTAEGPRFSLSVHIPDAPADFGYLVATQEGSSNPAAPFEITPTAAAAPPAPAPSSPPAPASNATPSELSAPSSRATAPRRVSSATANIVGGSPAISPASPARTTPTAPAPSALSATGGENAPAMALPSPRTAADDLWSGLAGSEPPARVGLAGRSAAGVAHGGGELGVGVALLVLGAVILAVGARLAVVRRPRARATLR